MASIRKIFLDSRINSTGTPSDFTTQLPQEIATRRTQGLVLGQFSIANVFTTVMSGYNDILYYRLDGNTMQTSSQARTTSSTTSCGPTTRAGPGTTSPP